MKNQRRKSPRYPIYDYNLPGYYFITTCVKGFKHVFGQVKNSFMIKNEFGKIVEQCWLDLPEHYKNVELDYFVVMPNHFHGIIIINEKPVGDGLRPSPFKSTPTKSCSVTEAMRAFKSFSSRRINELRNPNEKFKWQRSFYDRIIRNEKELYRIRKYIEQNPIKWDLEKNVSDNIDIF